MALEIRSEELTHATTWINFENIILNERKQSEDHGSLHMKVQNGERQRVEAERGLVNAWGQGD